MTQHVVHIVIVHIADRPVLVVLPCVWADVVVRRMKLKMSTAFGANVPVRPLSRLFRCGYFSEAKSVEIVLRIPIGLFQNSCQCIPGPWFA
jgi:hypothetical protein